MKRAAQENGFGIVGLLSKLADLRLREVRRAFMLTKRHVITTALVVTHHAVVAVAVEVKKQSRAGHIKQAFCTVENAAVL
ncbi:hypothetical protein D3C81_2135060 [compost metagenome]